MATLQIPTLSGRSWDIGMPPSELEQVQAGRIKQQMALDTSRFQPEMQRLATKESRAQEQFELEKAALAERDEFFQTKGLASQLKFMTPPEQISYLQQVAGDPNNPMAENAADLMRVDPAQYNDVFVELDREGRERGWIKELATDRPGPTREERERELVIKEARLKQQALEEKGRNVDRELARQERKERNRLNRELKREQMEVRKQIAEDKRKDRLDKETANDMERLAKWSETNQSAFQNISELESLIGQDLNDYDPDTNTFKGLDVDIPGTSQPVVGRVYIPFRDVDQNFKAAAAKLFNIVLKDRSGAAVTSSEMKRLRTEFGEGGFANEAQLLAAMARFKQEVANVAKNMEAGYPDQVVQEYRKRGGKTATDMLPSPEPKVLEGDASHPSSGSEDYDFIYDPATGGFK